LTLCHYTSTLYIQVSNTAHNGRKVLEFRLDLHSGVPVYRQIIDQVMGGIARGALSAGDQLPTVRQVAVDLAINPNTVSRAYRELEIRGALETQQGTGTFISRKKVKRDDVERQRQLNQLVSEFVSRAGAAGFTIEELQEQLNDRSNDAGKKRR
jgi:GntR family transcriptional regulator